MGKMFFHYNGTVEQFKQLSNISEYASKIVFIKGGADGTGAAIYTHGEYYGTLDAALAQYQELSGKINNLKHFNKLSDGSVTAELTAHEGTLVIAGSSDVTTAVGADGFTVDLSTAAKTQIYTTLPNAIDEVSGRLGTKGDVADAGNEASAFGRIKNLETVVAGLTGTEGGKVESVDSKITKAINDLDVAEISGDYIKAVSQVDGKIEAIAGTFNFDEAGAAEAVKEQVIGGQGDTASANTIFGAKKYADDKAADAVSTAAGDATAKANAAEANAKADTKTKIEALDAVVSSTEGSHVTVKVTEVDGVVTVVNVTEDDIASAQELAKVKADVDYFFNDALKDGDAQQVKDTLKEIQEYIDGEAGGAAQMAQSIQEAKNAAQNAQTAANNAQTHSEGVASNLAEYQLNNNNRVTTIENSLKEDGTVGSQIAANTAAIQSITGADGSIASAVKNLKEEINESLAGKVDNTQYQLDKQAFAKADSDNLQAAKEHAEGLVNNLDVTDAAVAGEYVSEVSQDNGKISVKRTALPTYTLTTGSAQGTVALNGTDAAVNGLGSAAFVNSEVFATAAQGVKADNAAPQATTYTKAEVDAMWGWGTID